MSVITKYKKPLLIAGSLVGGYFLYKVIKNRKPSQGAALLNDEAAAKAKGQTLSYTQASYVNLANVIFNAWFQNFNIFNPVSETQVLSVMSKMNNDLDIISLTRAFGKRRAPIPFGSFLTSDLSLGEWLREGLYDNEIQAVNNVLRAKGITAQF
jgi:hypothetical protein